MIPSTLLKHYKARLVNIRKDQVLFEEGDPATSFLQIEEGQVKMYILNPEGQEFTQGIFNSGESFGEPALLGNFPYPSSAISLSAGKLWRMPKENFIQLLKDNFDIHLKLDQVLCQRLQYKAMILKEVSSHDPEHRLKTILNYMKQKLARRRTDERVLVPFTRQQLADMTGLRVETVIRTVKKMQRDGKLSMEGHKIVL